MASSVYSSDFNSITELIDETKGSIRQSAKNQASFLDDPVRDAAA